MGRLSVRNLTEEERELFDELAGKYEFDAEMTREKAETKAIGRILDIRFERGRDDNRGDQRN